MRRIGASDVSAVMGRSKFASPADIAAKIVDGRHDPPNAAMVAGGWLGRVAPRYVFPDAAPPAELVTELANDAVSVSPYADELRIVDPEREWLVGDFDAVWPDDDGDGLRAGELKTTGRVPSRPYTEALDQCQVLMYLAESAGLDLPSMTLSYLGGPIVEVARVVAGECIVTGLDRSDLWMPPEWLDAAVGDVVRIVTGGDPLDRDPTVYATVVMEYDRDWAHTSMLPALDAFWRDVVNAPEPPEGI